MGGGTGPGLITAVIEYSRNVRPSTHFSLLFPNWHPVIGWLNWPRDLGWTWEGVGFWKRLLNASPVETARAHLCGLRLQWQGPPFGVDYSAAPSHFKKIKARGGERVINDVFLFSGNKIFCFYFKPAVCPPLGPSRCLQ